MSKQDRTHSRTPADTENKFLLNLDDRFGEIKNELSKSVARIDKELTDKGASIGLLVSDGKVKGEVIIKAINGESEAKIKAKNILFEGEKLDIKVDDTHIDGQLTAKVLNIDNIKAKDVEISGTVTANDGEIGGWILGEYDIPTSATNTIKEKALYSGSIKHIVNDLVWYTVETWLTARGVYSVYKYYSNNDPLEPEFTTYYSSMWWDLLKKTNTSEKWKFTLDGGEIIEKEMFVS